MHSKYILLFIVLASSALCDDTLWNLLLKALAAALHLLLTNTGIYSIALPLFCFCSYPTVIIVNGLLLVTGVYLCFRGTHKYKVGIPLLALVSSFELLSEFWTYRWALSNNSQMIYIVTFLLSVVAAALFFVAHLKAPRSDFALLSVASAPTLAIFLARIFFFYGEASKESTITTFIVIAIGVMTVVIALLAFSRLHLAFITCTALCGAITFVIHLVRLYVYIRMRSLTVEDIAQLLDLSNFVRILYIAIIATSVIFSVLGLLFQLKTNPKHLAHTPDSDLEHNQNYLIQ